MADEEIAAKLEVLAESINQVRQWSNHYSKELGSIQKYVAEINTQNASLKTETSNRVSLARESLLLINALDITQSMEEAIKMKAEQINTEEGIKRVIAAAEQLRIGLTSDFHPQLLGIRAVRDQRQKMNQLKEILVKTLLSFFRHQFALRPKRQPVIDGEGQVRPLSREEISHNRGRLLALAPLSKWVKDMKGKDVMAQIQGYYQKATREQKKRDVELFFQHSRFWIKIESLTTNFLDLKTLKKSKGKKKMNVSSVLKVLKRKTGIHKVASFIMKAAVQAIMKERRFCTKFLCLSKKTANEVCESVFCGLEGPLLALVHEVSETSPFYLIYLMIHAQIHMDEMNRTGTVASPFVVYLMNKVQILSTQKFNKYLDAAITEMKAAPVKSGLLPHMKKLPIFIDRVEQYTTETSRSTVDLIYQKVILSTFAKLNVSEAKEKYTKNAIRYENYFYFMKNMEKRKILSIHEYVKQAKANYLSNLAVFVDYLLSKYFSSLLTFFENIESMIAGGVAEGDVNVKSSYQMKDFDKLANKSGKGVESKALLAVKQIEGLHPFDSNPKLNPAVKEAFKSKLLAHYSSWEKLAVACYSQSLPVSIKELDLVI